MAFGTNNLGGLKWDAGRTPPRTATSAIPCNAIVQIASGTGYFGIAGQAVASGQKYSLIREGYVELPVESTFTLSDGAKVPIVAGTGGFFEIGNVTSGETQYYIGRAVGAIESGSTHALVELVDFGG